MNNNSLSLLRHSSSIAFQEKTSSPCEHMEPKNDLPPAARARRVGKVEKARRSSNLERHFEH
jgi:hypothetical protein